MPGSSTSRFTNLEDYQADLGDAFAGLVVTTPAAFTACATRITLRHLSLLCARESLSRVAFVSLPSDRAFISFSSDPTHSVVWRGRRLGQGEIMFHGHRERLHQRTDGRSCWRMIELSTASLAELAIIETGAALAPPAMGQILRPSPNDRKRLVRIHREAARLAETRPQILSHPEVIRGMEAELGEVLAACLTNAEVCPETEAVRRANAIMVRFEETSDRSSGSKPPFGGGPRSARRLRSRVSQALPERFGCRCREIQALTAAWPGASCDHARGRRKSEHRRDRPARRLQQTPVFGLLPGCLRRNTLHDTAARQVGVMINHRAQNA